jgi:hypothetical protein
MLFIGLVLRLYGLSWDDGYHFHPDERQILIVADSISFPWPPDPALLLTPDSTWNPRFFSYGSLPIYLLRLTADLAGRFVYDYATLRSSYMVGRVTATLFDVGTIYLTYRLGRRLYGEIEGLLAGTLVALTVLHIQLSHFYTVDTPLTFFVTLLVMQAIEAARDPTPGRAWGMGLAWGMALATKLSGVLLIAPVTAAWLLGMWAQAPEGARAVRYAPLAGRWVWRALWRCGLTALVALSALAVFQPYTFIDPVCLALDAVNEARMVRGLRDVPYTLQFYGTAPYLYPLRQLVVWGMGLPLGIVAVAATWAGAAHAFRLAAEGRRQRAAQWLVPLIWVATYFGTVGGLHARFARYMLPIVPFLCLWAAWAIVTLLRRDRWFRSAGVVVLVIILGGTALYALAFTNVYRQEHPWLQASRWLCRNLPPGSRVMVEHWDDPLPIWQGRGELRCHRAYEYTVFRAYDADDTAKLEHLLDALENSDTIILSSHRLYSAIPRAPERYPLTARYYTLLMAGELGFEPIYYVAVYPELVGIRLESDPFAAAGLPRPVLPGESAGAWLRINLGPADESLTVYDHPMPLVFRRTTYLSRQELLERLNDVAPRPGLP